MTGSFVISLDFELLWGVRDHADRQSYGDNVLGARAAIPQMLDLFAENGVSATWATVGFLFCESKDELIDALPTRRPDYANSALSNYSYLDDVGQNEKTDPYFFAASLVERIAETPGQEVGTHTMSHFYCLEDGATTESFEADLTAALSLGHRRGIALKSIVFPRNQFGAAHLDICRQVGLTHYRGNPASWAYRAAKGAEQTPLRRALRLADAYTGVLGAHGFVPGGAPFDGAPRNVAASRFLRPRAGRLAPLHSRHIATIKHGMSAAARNGNGYHLWWHPHNFGKNLDENIAALRQVVAHYQSLRDTFAMTSATMSGAP